MVGADAGREQLGVDGRRVIAVATVDVAVGNSNTVLVVAERLGHQVAHLGPGRRRALTDDPPRVDVDEVRAAGDVVVAPGRAAAHDVQPWTGDLGQRRRGLLVVPLRHDEQLAPAGDVHGRAELAPEAGAHAAAGGEEGEQGAAAEVHRPLCTAEVGADDLRRGRVTGATGRDDPALELDGDGTGAPFARPLLLDLTVELEAGAEVVQGLEDQRMAAQQAEDEE